MGLPYYQLDADFIATTSKLLAARLKVSKREAIGLVAELIPFVVEATSTQETPPDGVFIGPDAASDIEAGAEWRGEPGALISALVATRVVERLELGLRFRGCDRYAAAWVNSEKRSSKARKAAEARWANARSNAQPMLGASSEQCLDDAPGCLDQDVDVDGDVVKPPPPSSSDVVVVGGGESLSVEGDVYPVTENGVWALLQRIREVNGLAVEASRPKGFLKWVHQATREAGLAGIKSAYIDFVVDDTIKSQTHATAVFITPGMWDGRKPARAAQ
jgi:hypothetical protein